MKNLKLHEIIELNEEDTNAILIELLLPYKKSLLTYYSNYFASEPALMVTAVMNAAQYGKIVPSDELWDAFIAYDNGETENIQDQSDYFEEICSNSMLLKNL